jgi:hypothetical protein
VAEDQRLATELVLVLHDRRDGMVRGRNVDVCLRAALLSELALNGHIVSVKGAPVASSSGTDDPILGAVHSAIQRRPRVAWRRWFRHVQDDRGALLDDLVASARLTPQSTKSFTDTLPDRTRSLRNRLLDLETEPGQQRTPHDAVLGYLFVLAQSRNVASHWDEVLRRALVGAEPQAGVTVLVVLRATGQVLGRRRLLRH